ncbi:MAG TPA: PHB depolymerase family esterase [Xanthobacteraceae bacterium]|nr:PHB depolymerase family esterase [Xanthobacteraceae bacterium]
MFSYAPPDLPPASALVVVLHGCEQTAEDYDRGAGWSALAEREGFALLFPQQQPQNNANSSFNWFRPDDIGRGVGEALSIQQMTEDMIVSNGIDRRRVFVTGFSAGGAMANVMLAAYPDVFAAGAIIAGLPYGAAGSDEEAVRSMQRPAARTPREWGAQVRAAFLPKAPWPRVAVWHGAADTTVVPANADALLTQWLDVHGIETPAVSKPGRPTVSHRIWRDAEGRVRVEDHRIAGLAHGAPVRIIGPGRGVAGPFFLDVGISATLDIAHSWGLVAAEPKRGTVQSAALRRGTAPQY